MNIVGDHLREMAAKEKDRLRFDLFSRSAFNRYYYSAFLAVRAALGTIDSKWQKPNHAAIPALLKGQVIERLHAQLSINKKRGGRLDAETERLYSRARSAADELSTFLRTANAVRRVADYEPETKVDRMEQPGGARLARCTIDEARGWRQRAEACTSTILRAYKRLGLA